MKDRSVKQIMFRKGTREKKRVKEGEYGWYTLYTYI
jgi:hypothetical protein